MFSDWLFTGGIPCGHRIVWCGLQNDNSFLSVGYALICLSYSTGCETHFSGVLLLGPGVLA